MSLDVYLKIPGKTQVTGAKIFIREDGQTKEISVDEWNARFPDREPHMTTERTTSEVYSANITHNLGAMADAAGIYKALWRPEEIGITHARQLIEPLTKGLEMLQATPSDFYIHSPANGWGNYDGLCLFVQNYLAACKQYPDAEVSVSR